MPKVLFVETRQIRRNHKTVQWRAGETYEFDKEMQPMIDIGHARIVEEPIETAPVVPAVPASPPVAPAPMTRQAPSAAKTSGK